MAFKMISDYNEEKYGGLFVLRGNNDYADVIFLYNSVSDVLVAETYYIKTKDYSGYVHYNPGSPAGEKGLRVQTKLFIPLYNITTDRVEFWDRNIRFETILSTSVFSKVPNPSEYVFRIVRHGDAGDVNTKYNISLMGKNSVMTYDEILRRFNIKLPDHYETICKDIPNSELASMLLEPATPTDYTMTDSADYVPMPRRTEYVEYERATPRYEVPNPMTHEVTTHSVPTPNMTAQSDRLPSSYDQVDSTYYSDADIDDVSF